MFHRDDNELGAYNDDSGDESYQETDTESDRDEPEVYDSHNADDFDHLNVVHDLDDTVHEGDMDTSISAPGRPPTRRAARKDKRYTVDVDEVVRKALRKNSYISDNCWKTGTSVEPAAPKREPFLGYQLRH